MLDREKWLDERRKSIGGSDAAAIIGLSQYRTPYVIWADKTGLLTERPDNESMRQGRELEAYVAKRFEQKTGKKVRRHTNIIRNPKYPFAHGTIDREVIGEKALLECKTTSVLNLKRFKNGEYPETYYTQCVHYLAVTGYARAYLAVLILNKDFIIYEIERDEKEICALMDAEGRFWHDFVQTGLPPTPDGKTPSGDAIRKIFNVPRVNTVDLAEFNSEVEKFQSLKVQISSLEEHAEQIKQKLQLALAESDTGVCRDYIITWRNQTRKILDKPLLYKSYPEIDFTQFEKVTSFRQFKIIPKDYE